jgi:hypothetical protein
MPFSRRSLLFTVVLLLTYAAVVFGEEAASGKPDSDPILSVYVRLHRRGCSFLPSLLNRGFRKMKSPSVLR